MTLWHRILMRVFGIGARNGNSWLSVAAALLRGRREDNRQAGRQTPPSLQTSQGPIMFHNAEATSCFTVKGSGWEDPACVCGWGCLRGMG